MKIDRDVEPPRAQPPAERDVGDEPAHSARTRRDQDVVQMRIARDNRRGHGFDDIREVCVWVCDPQRVNRRGGEDDVADFPQADEQDVDVG